MLHVDTLHVALLLHLSLSFDGENGRYGAKRADDARKIEFDEFFTFFTGQKVGQWKCKEQILLRETSHIFCRCTHFCAYCRQGC
jgi:hypothetical protein